MSCVYESFCPEHELEFDTFAFEEQYDDLVYASILGSLSSIPSPSHETPPNVLLCSSLELKPFPNTLKYAFLGPNEIVPMIIANDLNSGYETKVLELLREN